MLKDGTTLELALVGMHNSAPTTALPASIMAEYQYRNILQLEVVRSCKRGVLFWGEWPLPAKI